MNPTVSPQEVDMPGTLKLGKLPAVPGAVKLKLSTYLEKPQLPTPPPEFGHDAQITAWEMLGNDTVGDCVIAGALHETMLWTSIGSTVIPVSTDSALKNYSAITGFNPDDPSSDQGTDPAKAASYRRKTGIVDANGKHHKIGAYLALTPGDVQEHLTALYLFGAVGVGVEFPQSAMDQFNAGEPWDVVTGAKIEGGHYISAVARRNGMLVIVTWGKEQPMTDAFLEKYNDESYAYISAEYLKSGQSPEGFNMRQLKADLAAVTSA
jgi:hypothetical protein